MNKTRTTISINGTMYDSRTGMPLAPSVASADTSPEPTPTPSHAVHTRTQRAKTLRRSTVSRPISQKQQMDFMPKKAATPHPKSPHISRFHSPSQKTSPTTASPLADVVAASPVTTHHHATVRARHRPAPAAAPTAPVPVSPAAQKHHAIAQALATSTSHTAKTPHVARRFSLRQRFSSVAAASLAVILLAGYITYMNLPGLSVRIAAAQSGVAATYPTYQPSGYSISGPVSYQEGKVAIHFQANVGQQKFTLSQTETNWDSSALLENMVDKKSKGNYTTFNDSGLTIYTYGTEASWVSGGVLRTIEGDATLTPEQIRKIATSM